MGKKRRLLASKGKFGNKFSAHPRYKVEKVTEVTSTLKVDDDISVIAKKIENIETEVLRTQDEIKKVAIEATPVIEPAVALSPAPTITKTVIAATPTESVKSKIAKKSAPMRKKVVANTTKRKSTTKRKTTSTTTKN